MHNYTSCPTYKYLVSLNSMQQFRRATFTNALLHMCSLYAKNFKFIRTKIPREIMELVFLVSNKFHESCAYIKTKLKD